MNVFTPVKKFSKLDTTPKFFVLSIMFLILVLGLLALDHFLDIVLPTTLLVGRAGLLVSAGILTILGAIYIWKEHMDFKESWYLNTCFILAVAAGTAGWSLLELLSATVLPETTLVQKLYFFIPGAFFFALGILSFVWRVVPRCTQKAWDSLKEAWRRA